MKRVPLLLICLLLILGVGMAASALAETPELRLSGMLPGGLDWCMPGPDEEITVYRAVIPYSWIEDGEGRFHDSSTYDFYIENFDELREVFDGDPQWSVELEDDMDLDVNFEVWEDGGRIWVRVGQESRPECGAEGRMTVSCAWGDKTASAVLKIIFEQVELPEAVDIPDVVELKADEVSTFDWGFLDGEGSRIEYWGKVWPVVWVNDYDNGLADELIERGTDEDGRVWLKPSAEAVGYWAGGISYFDSNIAITKQVVFRITDADGNIDEPQISMQDEQDFFMLLPGYDEKGFDTWLAPGEVCFLRPENAALLQMYYGEDNWEWSFDQLSGPELDIGIENDYDAYFNIAVYNLEELNPGDTAEVDATLRWGDASATVRLHFSFDRIELPDAIDWPAEIEMNVGEDYLFTAPVEPANWFGDYLTWCDPAEDSDWPFDMESLEEDRTTLSLRSFEPGLYLGVPHIHAANLFIYGPEVLIRVADEDGNVPISLEFEDEDAYSYFATRSIFDDDEEKGIYHGDWIRNYTIRNFEALSRVFEGEPVWKLTVTENTTDGELGSNIFDWEEEGRQAYGFDVYEEIRPTTPGRITYMVTCEWGGETKGGDGELVYEVASSLPEGLDLPDELELRIGEEFSVPVLPLPNDYPLGRQVWVDFNCDVDFDRDNWWKWEDDIPTQVIVPFESGVFPVEIALNMDNIRLPRNVWLYVLDEDGNRPELGLKLEGGAPFEEVPILNQFWDGDFGGVDLHTEDIMASFEIPEAYYDALSRQLGGAPEWSFTQKGAEDVETRLDIWDDGQDPRGMFLVINNMPEAPESVTYTVTCDWGDFHESREFTIRFVDYDDFPESLNIDDDLYLTAGERTEIAYSITPAGWYLTDNRHFDVWGVEGTELNGWCEFEDDRLYLTVEDPGLYVAIICLRDGSINLPKRFVTLHVADEDGNVPAPTLAFEDESMIDRVTQMAIFEEAGELGLIRDDWVTDYAIADFTTLRMLLDGDPEWSVEVDSDEIALVCNNWDWEGDFYGPRGFTLVLDGRYPDSYREVHYTVTCSWAGQTITTGGTIEFVELDSLPTGVNIPDEIELTVGEEAILELSYIPEDFTFADSDRINIDWRDDFDREDWCDGHTLHITPYEPGIFSAWIGVASGNINFGKDVLLRIADEDGNVPELVPAFWEDGASEYTIAIVPKEYDEKYNVYGDGWIDDLELRNAAAVAQIYDINEEWSVVQTDGEDLRPWVEPRDYGFALFIDAQPTKPGKASFTVTGRWNDEVSVTKEIVFDIVELETLPTGTTLYVDGEVVDELTMTVGDTIEVESAFNPAGWTMPNREDRWGFDMWLYSYDNHNEYLDLDWDGNTGWITAHRPGIYNLSSHTRSGNVLAYRSIKLTVTDEDGNVTGTVPVLGEDGYTMDVMLGTLTNDSNTGWLTDEIAVGYIPDNLQALIDTYGADAEIEWSVEVIDGLSLDVTARPYVDGGCEVALNAMPASTGTSTLRLTNTWNGVSGSIEFNLEFVQKPAKVPTEMTIPDHLRLKLGETTVLDGHYAAGSYDVDETFAWINADREDLIVDRDWEKAPFTLNLTPVHTGTFEVTAFVGGEANAFVRKFVTVTVVDPENLTVLSLPSRLGKIGEEAFTGISANVVVIPEGCTSIGKRAFANCGELVEVVIPGTVTDIADDAFEGCYSLTVTTDSAAVAAWAEAHGFSTVGE